MKLERDLFMLVLSADEVYKSFGRNVILENISFKMNSGEKLGIIGVNGSGKTTLLKIIAGIYTPDKGNITFAKGYVPGFLKQENLELNSTTVYQAVLDTFSSLIAMEENISQLQHQISKEQDPSALEQLMRKYSTMTHTFEDQGGFYYTSKTKGILKGLGFFENEFDMLVSSLSGGQRTSLMLAILLANEPKILLLDEPTNHLDLTSLGWLEEFISKYKHTVLVVSHDRYFLDKTCTGIFEIENGKGKYYSGNYTAFCDKKHTERENQQKLYENQQKQINRLEDFIEQQRRWNRERNIIAAESRMKAIERMDKIDKPDDLPDGIRLRIKSRIQSGNDVISAENISFKFGNKIIFKDISFNVARNEKLFIIGPNGCGKSTLVKVLANKLTPYKGVTITGRNINMAYYDQEFSDLNPENSAYDEILSINEKLSQTDIRNTLASLLFFGDDAFKKIGVLSGGEKSRILLAKLILSQPNLFIMDEPTNHLDINSKEILEEALTDFDGTLICVSHDRYFIKKIATRIIEFTSDGLFDYKGNYDSFVEYRRNTQDTSSQTQTNQKESQSKISYLAEKELRAKERKRIKMISDAEAQIHNTELKLNQIESEMELPTIQNNHIRLSELYNEKLKLEKKLEDEYILWEQLVNEG